MGEKNCYVWGDIKRQIDQDRSEHSGDYFASFIFTHREWDLDKPDEPEPEPDPEPEEPDNNNNQYELPDFDEIPFKIEFIRYVFKFLEYRFVWKTFQTIFFLIVADVLTKGFITTGVYFLWKWILENDYINKAITWF